MKILLVINALNFNRDQLNIPVEISTSANAQITALLIENSAALAVPLSKYGQLTEYQVPSPEDEQHKKDIIERNIDAYKQACLESGLDVSFSRARLVPLEETIEASRFSDLLLISTETSFDSGDIPVADKFVEEVLSGAQCPVWVMPVNTCPINEIIFTYNGTYSSVYAIKQFTHLFPTFKHKKVVVLYVAENGVEEIVNKRQIKKYLEHHYELIEFKQLTGTPSASIFSFLNKQNNCLVTFGAYGRSRLSQFFKRSAADNILHKLDLPVFITHP